MRSCKDCVNKKRREKIQSNKKLQEAKKLSDKRSYEKNKATRQVANKKWSAENHELMKEYARNYKMRNIELIRERERQYNIKNAEILKVKRKEHREVNKAAGAHYVRLRQARKAQRTPGWLTEDDYWMIKEAYLLAALRTKMFGFQWHVDHIIPLCGRNVSGLHVPSNLQVIPGAENMRKGYSYKVS